MANAFTVKRGEEDTYSLDLSPFNLTGATVWFTVKVDKDDDDASAVIQKEITTHVDAANGLTDLTLTRDDTDIAAGSYTFDITIVGTGLVKYTDPTPFKVQGTVKDTVI